MNRADISDIQGATVFLDLDGTVVAAGREDVDAASLEAVLALKAANRVVLVSNKKADGRIARMAGKLGVEALTSPYRKPDPRLRGAVAAYAAPHVVIGDRWLTDGLFAKLVGTRFIKVRRITRPDDPALDRALYAIDDALVAAGLLRPYHAVKNLLIFAPLFFAGAVSVPGLLGAAAAAFLAFTLAAGAGYAFNDVIDAARDREHPEKKGRAVASGAVSVQDALFVAALALAAAAFLVRAYAPEAGPWILAYLALSVLYSLVLKRVPLVEFIAFAGFYLLRVFVGGAATGLPLSPWLLLTVLFLALFLVAAKRYAERAKGRDRGTLKAYPERFLDGLMIMSATLTLLTYGLYTILGAGHDGAVWSTLFPLVGVMRYLQLVYGGAESEYPERLVVSDPWIRATVVLWAVFMGYIFYR